MLKELIPEYFMVECEDLFVNKLELNLGTRQDGKQVQDVELPTWAQGDVHLFLEKHRQALESDFVSQSLHKWIDLIFGHKQRSESDDNLFHPYSYEDLDIESFDEIDK